MLSHIILSLLAPLKLHLLPNFLRLACLETPVATILLCLYNKT